MKKFSDLLKEQKFDFQKSDLDYETYKYSSTTTGGDDPKKIVRDQKLLNRSEDYEIYDFIKSFSPQKIEEVRDIEKWIHNSKERSREKLAREIKTLLSIRRRENDIELE